MVEKDKAMMAALSAVPNGIVPEIVQCPTIARALARDPTLAKAMAREKESPVLEKARASFGDGDPSEKARAKEKATLAEASLEEAKVLANDIGLHIHQCDLVSTSWTASLMDLQGLQRHRQVLRSSRSTHHQTTLMVTSL